MAKVHESFARMLAADLSELFTIEVDVAASTTRSEGHIETIAQAGEGGLFTALDLHPLPRTVTFALDATLASSIVDGILGSPTETRALTELDVSLVSPWLQGLVASTKKSFETHVQLEPEVVGTRLIPNSRPQGPAPHVLLLVDFDVEWEEHRGRAQLWYPLETLDALFGDIAPVYSQGRSHDDVLRSRLDDVRLDFSVRMQPHGLRSGDIAGLQVGDVIPFGQNVAEPFVALVGDAPKFSVRPTRLGRSLACEILSFCPPNK